MKLDAFIYYVYNSLKDCQECNIIQGMQWETSQNIKETRRETVSHQYIGKGHINEANIHLKKITTKRDY